MLKQFVSIFVLAVLLSSVSSTMALQPNNLLDQIQSDRLMSHIQMLQGFYTRHVNSAQNSDTEGIGAAYKYLFGQFEQISQDSSGHLQVFAHSFHNYYDSRDTLQNNIVAIINGTEPAIPAIVIGAHYDSRTDDLLDRTTFAPGADDNGSGVAAVIEMARVMSQTRQRSTLMFVLFSGEEVDRQGSRAFVRDYLPQSGIRIGMMINIDTIGSNNTPDGMINDSQIRLFSPGDENAASRELARMIDFIAISRNTDLDIVKIDAADRPGRYGDHFSFGEVGYPAVRFIEAVEDTWKREGRDSIEFIEPDYLRRATRTILSVFMALSDGLRPPTSVALNDLNNGGRQMTWEQVQGATGYIVATRRPGETTYSLPFFTSGQNYDLDGSPVMSLAVAAIDANGMMGPLSKEMVVP